MYYGYQEKISRSTIASFAGFSQEVMEMIHQIILARYPGDVYNLARNPRAGVEVYQQVFGSKKPDLRTAQKLASRPLEGRCRELLIAKERRGTVISNFLWYNQPTEEETAILATRPTAAMARALLARNVANGDIRKRLVSKLNVMEIFEHVAYAPAGLFSVEETVKAVTDAASLPMRRVQRSSFLHGLRVLFSERPDMIDEILALKMLGLSASSLARRAALGSAGVQEHHVVDILGFGPDTQIMPGKDAEVTYKWMLQAALVNPRTPRWVHQRLLDPTTGYVAPDTRRDALQNVERPQVTTSTRSITDPATQQRLYDHGVTQGYSGMWTLRELALNPSISEKLVQGLRSRLNGATRMPMIADHLADLAALGYVKEDTLIAAAPFGSPNHGEKTVESLLLAETRLGLDASKWETLLALVNDSEGTFADLIETAELL
jgi:hypothetical protein